MQNLFDVGRREKALRKWQILAYFWFFLFVLFVSCPDPGPITTNEGLIRVFLHKEVPFRGLDDKRYSLGVKTPPKHDFFWGGVDKAS